MDRREVDRDDAIFLMVHKQALPLPYKPHNYTTTATLSVFHIFHPHLYGEFVLIAIILKRDKTAKLLKKSLHLVNKPERKSETWQKTFAWVAQNTKGWCQRCEFHIIKIQQQIRIFDIYQVKADKLFVQLTYKLTVSD